MLELVPLALVRCRRCGVRKAEGLFWKSGNQIRSHCKQCISEYARRSADRLREYGRGYRERNQEKIRAKVQNWHQRNPNAGVEFGRAWRAANSGKANAMYSKRRASKLKATPSWANHVLISLLYELAEQLTARTGVPHQIDHIVPLQSKIVCGLHCQANLRVVTAKENQSKGNRHWPDMP